MSAAARSRSPRWWANAVIYQVYPRSFQDSDGDGIGDLAGISSRLEYLEWLGVDAIWLSPIYRSPLADWGYDVADHTAVAPEYGTLEDFDRLVAEAHRRGLRVLLDLIPSHTSIEHPWFREHPERYVWADDGPPNNWIASFGGPAWTRDARSGRWYLHSFYPEQPDLDWRRDDVRAAFAEVVRFWLARGVDGFRVDAVDRLGKDPELRDDPPAEAPFALPLFGDHAKLDHRHSRNDTSVARALEALRDAAGDALLIGEVYLPSAQIAPYLGHLDLAFAFELMHAPFEAERLATLIEVALAGGSVAWVLSNHDFPRAASRLGPQQARLAAMLLLTLPGPAFLYQGEEIAMPDGPGSEPPLDRAGRDPHRHPMQWAAEPGGGFTTGEPWLPLTDPLERNVDAERGDPDSMLGLHRSLIALRRELSGSLEVLGLAAGDVLAYRRGAHLIVLNLGSEPARLPDGEVVLETRQGAARGRELAGRMGAVLRSS